MFNSVRAIAAAITILAPVVFAGEYNAALNDLGRAATSEEIAAWDIDVRPDFKGLPSGSGSVEEGEALWLDKCAVCHGDFGDSNEVFAPIGLGNITPDDIESGRVAALMNPAVIRTTLMKVSSLSTIWDYINRAMHWNAPKSLKTDEVYALVAYVLNLGYIVDYDFILSDENIADVQALMPNRNGTTRDHGLWAVGDKPDVVGSDCTTNCQVDTTVTSFLPAYAMNAHGNLRDQMREFGPYRGLQTAPVSAADAVVELVSGPPTDLLADNGCSGCHQMDKKLVGPGLSEIIAKYSQRSDAAEYLAGKIKNGGSGVWGSIAMPPMAQVDGESARIIAKWLAGKS